MERIHVSVRARPLTAEDAKSCPWRISGNSIFIPNQPTKFEFDHIFREDCKTLQVYSARIKDIVAATVRGFNGTVFAYGQTNSGKTHTMRGSPFEPGVIRLAMQDLFDVIQQEMEREFLLRMSYMEIYNEEINDLLAPEHRKLQIHESIERGIFVAGLREEIVASPEQVLQLMEFGEAHRHIGETNMNLYSSRSHTIFRMIIESREKSEGADLESSCDAVRVSVLNLVDLAGSERAAKTGAEGVRLKEGSHINKSLMTLGTVIKKLSEGADGNGGHVPYRDSKLTRILQPALGGNANTAIICNITLAQVHADETKSSLQFASRALRVTNCVHVNEILTDAALLKRQKKEIEELRAKLQGSHSEHLEEEILNLRNTLLKSELERERISLELEEEKKAQAEREKRLQEQAKKIENLSSMVLCSNRDEKRDLYKKEKRRDTWCPGNLSRETLRELYMIEEKASAEKTMRPKRDMKPLLPFEELVNEASMAESPEQEEDCKKIESEDCTLPDPCSLLHVTSRRKPPTRKKSSLMENDDLLEIRAAYEELLVEFETHRTMSEIQIEYLKGKLAEANSRADIPMQDNSITLHENANKSIRGSDAIFVIKQLQEKITMLEMEKSSSQQNLDCIVELATEQTISAREKYQELYEELLCAQEEVKIACEQHNSGQSSMEENADFLIKLCAEVEELMSEVESSRNLIESVTPIVDELFPCFSGISNFFLDLKSSSYEISVQIKSMISDNKELQSWLRREIDELKDEKLLMHDQSLDLRNHIEQVNLDIQSSTNAWTELSEQFEVEKSELLSQIQNLQKEMLKLSSSSLAREKESMRKDLEKTKMKQRDMESKLKNVIQEKTKLEGEKACAERNIKLLHEQKASLERDINRRMSVVGRCDSTIDRRNSNVVDLKRSRGAAFAAEQAMQEEYRRLEVLMFEMETTIASLEEELAVARHGKEEANSRAEILSCELEALAHELNVPNKELITLKEEVLELRLSLEESESHNQRLKSSMSMLEEEREDLAMQLTDALLAMEEEKAIWSAKEKASVEAIEIKAKSFAAELANLSKELSEVKKELEVRKEECKVLTERSKILEENANLEKKYSIEKSFEIDRPRSDLTIADDENKKSQEQEILSLEHHSTCEQVERLQEELNRLKKEKDNLLCRVRLDSGSVPSDNCQLLRSKNELEALSERLESLEFKMHKDEIKFHIETTKLRMRLRGTHNKLDAFRSRYKETMEEKEVMNKRYEEASANLKDKLVKFGTENLNLKKELAILKDTN